MKNLILIVTVLLSIPFAKAQDVFFPTKVGTELVYKTFDPQDKVTETIRYTITKVTIKSREEMDITYLVNSIGPNEEPIFKDEITVHKIDGKLRADMRKYIDKTAFEKEGELPLDIRITGNVMEIPSNVEPGDILPDAQIQMAMKIGYMNLKMLAKITDRYVESFQTVNVKAGEFDVYKFTSNVTAEARGVTTTSKLIEWLAKGVGLVKSEKYDKFGKLDSRIELVEMRD